MTKDLALHYSAAESLSEAGPLARLIENWQARRAATSLLDLDDHLLSDAGLVRAAQPECHFGSGRKTAPKGQPRRSERSTELRRSSAAVPRGVPAPVTSSMARRPRSIPCWLGAC
jgi:hypothetical protein